MKAEEWGLGGGRVSRAPKRPEFDLVAFGRRASLTGGLVMNPDLSRSLRPLVGTPRPWRVETCRELGSRDCI